MKADPQRIHQLEHELGFRDDPPPAVWTDKPGALIPYHDHGTGRPEWLQAPAIQLDELQQRARQLQLERDEDQYFCVQMQIWAITTAASGIVAVLILGWPV